MAWENVSYVCFGKEVGENGTPHLQGYVTFKATWRLSALKLLLPRAHWEQAKGNRAHNREYCSKDGDFWESEAQTVTKSALKRACETVAEGGLRKLLAEDPATFVRNCNGLKQLAAFHLKPRDRNDKPTVHWYFGPSGTGKTKAVYEFAEEKGMEVWTAAGSLQWWDGYHQQEVVLMDDFRKDYCTYHLLLQYLDRYPVMVPFKGGFTNLNSKHFFITCPWHPCSERMYGGQDDSAKQLTRRIDHLHEFIGDGTEDNEPWTLPNPVATFNM